jgi:hypothetical protein
VRLTSVDGSFVDLHVVGYQFPDRSGDGPGDDWDANWLVIRGEVNDGGHTSVFVDPCLTTWEAGEVGAWLRGVASGAVQAAPYEGGFDPYENDDHQMLVFTEPNLGFGLSERSVAAARIRVYLSAEARPSRACVGTDIYAAQYAYYVALTVPPRQLEVAAGEWEAEVARFPRR